jgi:cob(I)alamin adenosyltransferase
VVKLNKIYTRTGDNGTTGLVDGSRVSKSDPLMAAIGTVEEANAGLGLAVISIGDDAHRAMVARIQNELFDLGADLATPYQPDETEGAALRVTPAQATRLEAEMDMMNETLEPLRSFILPGGHASAAALHQARTVVRRAERLAVAANQDRGLNPAALVYLNRLSDHLFVLARAINAAAGGDILWQPGATR